MMSIYGKFLRGIAWNSLESIGYHAVFLTHQLILFRTIDCTLYGTMSSLIAGIYFIVMLANIGLDASMGPFFGLMTASRNNYIRYFVSQCALQLIVVLPGCALVGTLVANRILPAIPGGTLLWLIIMAIVVSEGMKRSLRTFLQLAFLNHVTTKTEVCSIAGYCLLVWSGIFLRGHCTLIGLLLPLLISSIASTLYLARVVHGWFLTLPTTEVTYETYAIWGRIIKTRILGCMSITVQQLFSSNFLTPALALHSGAHAAGAFSIIATVISSLTSLFHKIGGYTTQALLAHLKHAELKIKQSAFSFITTQLFHLMSVVVCFLAINYRTLLAYNSHIATFPSIMLFAYTYVGLMLCEYATMAYEKFLINEERVDYLGLYQGLVIVCCIAAVMISKQTYALCGSLLCIRIASLIGLSYGAYYSWGIRPRIVLSPTYILIAVSVSYIINTLLHYSI